APCSQFPVHLVAMDVRTVASALRSNTLREHRQDFFILFALEIAVRIGPLRHRKHLVFVAFFSGTSGNNLLREDIERRIRNDDLVEIAEQYRTNSSRTFD